MEPKLTTLSSSVEIRPCPAHEVLFVWAQVEPFVSAAVAESANRWTELDVLTRLIARDMQLWVLLDAERLHGVVVTEIYPTAAGKTCALPIVAGDVMEHLGLLSVIAAWAKECGCVRLEGLGRPGWERALKALGWRKIMTMYEARI